MWIVENEGDALQGNKLWLRPGKKFVFGRTLSGEGQFVVSDKTISRQHLCVEVQPTSLADCGNASSRSRVVLTDLGTKIGTLVNGEQIRGKAHELEREDNVVSLGRYKHHFRFTWIPVSFTFSFTSKESKADPYTPLYRALGPLDIKVLKDYNRYETTHLVAKKRNTSKGLQALIDGKYIVNNDSYVEAVVEAATAGSSGSAPLEEDFANFPDSLQYLPPKGEEPTSHDDTWYAPDSSRQDMFDGYTFIFYDSRQFDTLLAPITAGRGKAYLREVIPNQTTVDDFVRYVKSIAGERGLGEFEDGSEGKGVVVVRFNPVKGVGADWFASFGREVALRLDHRLIEQNEFLDAILGNNASVLRRPLGVESAAPPPTAEVIVNSQSREASQPLEPPKTEIAPPEPVRRGRSRRTAAPRFKGFDDDDFDAPPNLHSIPEAQPMVLDPTPVVEPQSQGLFVSQDPDVPIERESSEPPTRQTRRTRRGRTTPIDDDDLLESMAPAAARFKKTRQAEDDARRERGEPSPSPPPAPAEKAKQPSPLPKKKPEKKIDVQEVIRERMEKASAAAEADREAIQEAFGGMDIQSLRNLAQVEEMDVTRTNPRPQAVAQADESERWDERWNGRKNFKKFRRKGAAAPNARDFRRVIVPLEEVKKKDFGIGDEYWFDGGDRESRERGREGQLSGSRRPGRETQDDVSQQRTAQAQAPRPKRRLAAESEPEDESTMTAAADDDSAAAILLPASDVEIIEEPPQRTTRTSRSKTQTTVDDSQSVPSQNKSKRAATTTLTKPAPAKKAKQTPLSVGGGKRRRDASDGDSDDELKFRFRKRS